jgi:hypothetical protein
MQKIHSISIKLGSTEHYVFFLNKYTLLSFFFFFFFYNFRIYISYLIDSNNLIHIIKCLSPSVFDFFNDAISKTVWKQNLDNNIEEQTEENKYPIVHPNPAKVIHIWGQKYISNNIVISSMIFKEERFRNTKWVSRSRIVEEGQKIQRTKQK